MEDSVRDRLISKISLLRKQLDAVAVTIGTADELLWDEWGTRSTRDDLDLLRQQLSLLATYTERLERRQLHLRDALQSVDA